MFGQFVCLLCFIAKHMGYSQVTCDWLTATIYSTLNIASAPTAHIPALFVHNN